MQTNLNSCSLFLYLHEQKEHCLRKLLQKGGQEINLIFSQTYRGFKVITTCLFRITLSELLTAEGFVGVLRFSCYLKKRLVEATFVSVLDCGDAPYMNTPVQSLHMLDGGLGWIMVL